MKKTAILFATLFCLLFSWRVFALENLGGFLIENFDVGIRIEDDGSFFVEEEILVDFSEERHGIFRKIPFKYKSPAGTKFNLRMDQFDVYNEQGKKRPFEKYKEQGSWVLKIGDASALVSGKQKYVIRYRATNGLRFFDDHTELYWNPIGTDWPSTIKNANANVVFHKNLNLSDDDVRCFVGTLGSQGQDCRIETSNRHASFSSNTFLDPYHGMTIAISFPVDFVPVPTFWDKMMYFLVDNWGFLIPFVVFLVMFFVWFFQGKEIKLGRTVIAQYEAPEKLTPGEMGYLLKENYTPDMISADIVNLAVKGYLKINESEKDDLFKDLRKTLGITQGAKEYELEKLKDWSADGSLRKHEKRLLDGLFDKGAKSKAKLSSLKNFHEDVKKAKKDLKKQIDSLDYFEAGKLNKKALWVFLGAAVVFLGIMFGGNFQRIDFIVGSIASGVIMIIFGIFMSKRTKKGAESILVAKGFKLYINTAERYRVKFQEDEHIFEKVLPFAMIFGIADKWAKAFEGIYDHNPAWYSSSTIAPFRPVVFADSLNSGFGNAAKTVSAPPQSSSSSGFSGGGFSGGGGGGGGGGSW